MSFYKDGKAFYPLPILEDLAAAITAPDPVTGEPLWDEVITPWTGEMGLRAFKSRALVDGEPIYVSLNATSIDTTNGISDWAPVCDYYWGFEPNQAAYHLLNSWGRNGYQYRSNSGYINFGIVITGGRKEQDLERVNSNRKCQCLILDRYTVSRTQSQDYGWPPYPSISIEYPTIMFDWVVIVKPTSIFLNVNGSLGYIGTVETVNEMFRQPIVLFTSTQPHEQITTTTTLIDGEYDLKNGYKLSTQYGEANWFNVTFGRGHPDRKLLLYPYQVYTNYGGEPKLLGAIRDAYGCGLYLANSDTFFNFDNGYVEFNLNGNTYLFIRTSAQSSRFYYRNSTETELISAFSNDSLIQDVQGRTPPIFLIGLN